MTTDETLKPRERVTLWRQKNRERYNAYMRDYYRKRREAEAALRADPSVERIATGKYVRHQSTAGRPGPRSDSGGVSKPVRDLSDLPSSTPRDRTAVEGAQPPAAEQPRQSVRGVSPSRPSKLKPAKKRRVPAKGAG